LSDTLSRPGAAVDGIHSQLRRSTRQEHEGLEDRLRILDRLADPDDRILLLRRFWGLHRGAELALSPVLADVPELDYPARHKSDLLRDGIAELTGRPDPKPHALCTFVNLTPGRALGFAYVMEGSALGGLVIHREMAARGQPLTGLGFFNAYGRMTGARWRDFLAVIEREAAAGGERMVAAMVEGATEGFRRTEAWLCDGVELA
jgi:heme oxygenase